MIWTGSQENISSIVQSIHNKKIIALLSYDYSEMFHVLDIVRKSLKQDSISLSCKSREEALGIDGLFVYASNDLEDYILEFNGGSMYRIKSFALDSYKINYDLVVVDYNKLTKSLKLRESGYILVVAVKNSNADKLKSIDASLKAKFNEEAQTILISNKINL